MCRAPFCDSRDHIDDALFSNVLYNCTPPAPAPATVNRATCKGGPPLPMSTSKKNVIWIGDSLSLGMIPYVTANLSDIALVQHAPWGSDGGTCVPRGWHSQLSRLLYQSPRSFLQ